MPRMDERAANAQLWRGRVARLATVRPDGTPHVVPVVYAQEGQRLAIPTDHKAKAGRTLQRLTNIEANPNVSLLVDHYGDDWSTLWWVRADGRASITKQSALLTALQAKYPQYVDFPPEGPFIEIELDSVSGWSAV